MFLSNRSGNLQYLHLSAASLVFAEHCVPVAPPLLRNLLGFLQHVKENPTGLKETGDQQFTVSVRVDGEDNRGEIKTTQ